MGELLPCPFCGSEAEIIVSEDDDGRFAAVSCPKCGAGSRQHYFCGEDAREFAADAWNTRPRTEGRGDQEPVAWQEAAEPFFRLAREVINPVNGERPWHADSKDWMVVFSFAGQSVTLGDLRRAAVASPIREPEISKLTKEAIVDAIREIVSADIHFDLCCVEEAADAILNLAPVGGRGAVSASDRAFVRHLIREMRSAIVDDPNDATITTGPLDPDILERVLNVALGAQEQGGMK